MVEEMSAAPMGQVEMVAVSERRAGPGATGAARKGAAANRSVTVARAACALVVLLGGLTWLVRSDVTRAAPAPVDPGADLWAGILVATVVAACALVTLRQRPGHAIGWLLLAYGLCGALAGLCWQVALREDFLPGGDRVTAVGWAGVQESLSELQFGLILLILLLFPTGRPPSPRWNRLVPITGGVFVAWSLLHTFAPGQVHEDPFMGRAVPWAAPVAALRVVRRAALPLAAVLAVLVLVSLLVRFRASKGEERQQIKWVGLLVAGVPVALVALVAAMPFGFDVVDVVGNTLALMLQVGLPVAVVVAVTRYRLYDLDLVVNRSLVYAVLSLVLFATYALSVLLFTRIVVGVGWRSPVVVAGATLAAAVVVSPAHRRAQELADRLFQRRAWAANRQIEAFAAASRSTGRPPGALRDLLAIVLDDPDLSLALRTRHPEAWVDPDGRLIDLDEVARGRDRLEIQVAGSGVAVLVHDPARSRDQRLLSVVVESTRLLLENARLQAEGLAQLAEVRASRARIVEAGDAERRRIERDLHDGAQQRLVAVALRLKLAAGHSGTSEGTPASHLLELAAEVQAAIGELRELARGLHPVALEEGLGAALESLVARSPVAVDIEVQEAGLAPDTRLSAYFVAAEAITNAIKHARVQRVVVRGTRDPDSFTLTVRDQGRGGAHPAPGSGLAGLADRVAAVGGQLRIDSPPGVGTTIEARLPCDC